MTVQPVVVQPFDPEAFHLFLGASPLEESARHYVWKAIAGFILRPTAEECTKGRQVLKIQCVPRKKEDRKEFSREGVEASLAKRLARAKGAYDRDAEEKRVLAELGLLETSDETPFNPAHTVSVKEADYAWATHRGGRSFNEDAVFIHTGDAAGVPFQFTAVLDGHRKDKAGVRDNCAIRFLFARLGDELNKVLELALKDGYATERLYPALKSLFQQLQKEVQAEAHSDGTTVTGTLQIAEDVWTVQLGDSIAEAHAQDGTVIPLSDEASAQDPDYLKGAIARGGVGFVVPAMHEGKECVLTARLLGYNERGFLFPVLNLTRAFGDRHVPGLLARPKLTRMAADHQLIALFSDGMTQTASREEVSGWIREEVAACEDDLELAARNLIERAYHSGSRDNITVILRKT